MERLDDTTDDQPPKDLAATPPVRRGWLLITVLICAVGALALWLWLRAGSGPTAPSPTSLEGVDLRVLELENQVTRLRELQRSNARALEDAASRNRLLRDETLALSQRAALLEENLQSLSQQTQEGRAATALDETELLLNLAQARWYAAGDLAGAQRATEQAVAAMLRVQDPRYLSLRQSLLQESAELKALPRDPVRDGLRRLDALSAKLPELAAPSAAAPTTLSAWERLLSSLIDVRDAGEQRVFDPAGRQIGESALAQEIATARLAIYLRDEAALDESCARIDRWLVQLFADGPLLREQRAALKRLGDEPMQLQAPLFGSSLELLRGLRGGPTSP